MGQDDVFEVGDLVYFDEGVGIGAIEGIGIIIGEVGVGLGLGYRIKALYPRWPAEDTDEVYMFSTEMRLATIAEAAAWRIKHGSV